MAKEGAMTIELTREYVTEIKWRYKNARKKEKTKILDEFCHVSKYNRKYAIRLLNRPLKRRGIKSGPKSKYQREDFIATLKELWLAMNKMCSKKMVVAFEKWLPFYECPAEIRNLLNEISPSTVDRILKPVREPNRGFSTTRGGLIKNKIPLKLLDGEIKMPGYVEADTVAHCGTSIAGEYTHSLTVTDLFSGWTENRAAWTKTAEAVLREAKDVEESLPFALIGFASDNGSEFINDDLHDYLTKRKAPVNMVRRRPYKKNDSAHVEQKNWTHVREIFGYRRYEQKELVAMMNEIYRAYWNPLWNYFTPVLKLKSKERIGGRIKKLYDEPKTPCDRLLESTYITTEDRRKLLEGYRSKNPFTLKKMLEEKLKEFYRLVEEHERRQLFTGS
jgi:hypothetical protein